MQQSIFVIRHDFFDNPEAGREFVKKLVDENCKSEKVILLFDPVAEEFFLHVAKQDRDMFEAIVRDFYDNLESESNGMDLQWFQLDENVTFHITFLSPLLFDLDKRFGGYLLGCIPLTDYNPNLSLYFCMTEYDMEDVFVFFDKKTYMKLLNIQIEKFNSSVPDAKKFRNSKRN